MFFDDIQLVKEQIRKHAPHGHLQPLVDLGGLARPTIADYQRTIDTGDQHARYLRLANNVRPFDSLDPSYLIMNPEQGDAPIERLPAFYRNYFGTIICLSTLEHVKNPFEVFEAFYQLLQPNGLLVLSTVFSFPYHPSPDDFWRFTPACLQMLAETAHLHVLESDWRLNILADAGVKEIHTGVPQEIKSVYVTAMKLPI